MATLTRMRGKVFLAAILGTALALTGCSSDDPSANETPPAAGSDSDTAFPVTVETTRGEVTVNEEPERIVVLMPVYMEYIDILDLDTVAWVGYLDVTSADQMYEDFPWWEDNVSFASDPDPNLFNADYTINVEAVAAYDPDLILTTVWIEDQVYDQLAQIAPTYGDYGAPSVEGVGWQDLLTDLATLTGQDTTVVDAIDAELDAEFAAARDLLPGLQGVTFQAPGANDSGGLDLTYHGNNALIDLGLVPGDSQPTTADDQPTISLENIEMLNADVLFLQLDLRGDEVEEVLESALEADPRVAELPAKQNGTWIELTYEQWQAIHTGGTPSSNRWFLDQVVPELEASALNQSGQ